ncbi:hypothetical protein C8R44DRAFT_823716 [Mycena epipterygia]|nr:hypothetical protein C8R44DRAFT_823716 [Mycena epipterygia]
MSSLSSICSLGPTPSLPLELERYIFEMAAFIHPPCMSALLLVARRAKIWVEPLLYQVLLIGFDIEGIVGVPLDGIPQLVDSRPPAFFHDHVRHLSVLVSPDNAKKVMPLLAVCHATANLHLIGGHPSLLPLLGAMPLRRLSARLSALFPSGPDFSLPLFTNITHLNLLDWPGYTWNRWSGLAQIPSLTHLSFHNSPADPAFCHEALMHAKSLQVLAFFLSDDKEYLEFASRYATLAFDPRFVILVIAGLFVDWARGGEDCWAKAEEFVAERRSGETKSFYFVVNSTS